jgi:hypothetical protein
MNELRIIIAGSRSFNDYQCLRKESLKIVRETVIKLTGNPSIQKELVTIVSGCAKGADSLGEQFAKEFGLKLKQFPANWDRYGRRAGYMRNTDMATFASDQENQKAHGILIAFWDGQSKGTKHMIDIANKLNIDVHVINFNHT